LAKKLLFGVLTLFVIFGNVAIDYRFEKMNVKVESCSVRVYLF